MASPNESALRRLITTYYELNSSSIEELDCEPSPLEFMRYVSRNTPFVIRGGASSWKATQQWNAAYLKEALAGQSVNVAVTPHGSVNLPICHSLELAFSPAPQLPVTLMPPHFRLNTMPLFCRSLTRNLSPLGTSCPTSYGKRGQLTVLKLMRCVMHKPVSFLFPAFSPCCPSISYHGCNHCGNEVKYICTYMHMYMCRFLTLAQENDNFKDEYSCLLPDAQKDIPFARIALQKSPDAVNLWIGNSKSVTAAHKDNFENIFVQVIGRKHFVLLPPVCHPCMNEALLKPATYNRDGQGLSLRLDEGAELVPFATWDPDSPEDSSTPLSGFAKPMRVTLDPGDMLYLPAMW